MKGLLIKDFYMMMKYCRVYFLIIPIFLVVSFITDGNLFFVLYPCLFAGMIPQTLLSYDERSQWDAYSAAMPYSRRAIVTSKYLIGFIVQTIVLAISLCGQMVRMHAAGDLAGLSGFAGWAAVFAIATWIGPTLILPVIFKWGTEKGRVAYYGVVAVAIGAVVGIGALLGEGVFMAEKLMWILTGGTIGMLLLYIGSWFLSVKFYEGRQF